MGKSSPSPPPPPDYVGAAQAQGVANKESAIASNLLSNPNVYSPYGNQTFAGGEDGTRPTMTQTLTPEAQATLTQQQQVQRQLAELGGQGVQTAQGVMGTPFGFGGPQVQTGLDTSGIALMPVNAGMTGQDAIMSRLEPMQQRQRVSQETALTNQGLRPGMEAYDNGMRDFTQGQNDLKTQAALQGINLDMSANNQGFNQALQGGQFGNTAQQQALAQAIQQRQMPLNEITALMSGSQIQTPTFGSYQGASIQPAPIMQGTMAQGQSAMNIFNQQQAASNAQNAGLFSLGGSALGAASMFFSDRRLKSNIRRIGTHPLGIGIYAYEIFGIPDTGVMAQELMAVKPDAVHVHRSGYLMVDYGAL